MKAQELVDSLSAAIAGAAQSANYCVSGSLPQADPSIEVQGLGPLKLPLAPAAAKRLAAVCNQAPYGKGTRTLVDTKVRNAFELSPTQFTIANPQWDEAIRAALQTVAEQLGLPADRLQPRLYKLLLYGTGGLFLPHRDSEKSDRMVGSLIVALPSRFRGGTLKVRHRGSSQRFDFEEAAAGRAPCFAAFYADCEHEVARVEHGFRLCLAYNLVLCAARRERTAPAAQVSPARQLAQSLANWAATAGSEPLVFALDHHYTQRGLSLDLLKGHDRSTANLVLAAAELAECHVYLCQVSRHISQFADDGRWGRRWRSENVPADLSLGEVYEDELQGAQWVNVRGKRQPFPEIPLPAASIIASTPLDEWTPTREEYEGYTGNAGNTLDRWYHRSALCVWHRDHHYEVLARGGIVWALDLMFAMIARLEKTPKKRLDQARQECLRLAQAIIGQWPQRHPNSFMPRSDYDQLLSAFPRSLVELDDPETARQLLKVAAPRDPGLKLDKLVVPMCRRHGCARFADELSALWEGEGEGLLVRDAQWLDRLAAARLEDPAGEKLIAGLARLAATRFCRPLNSNRYYHEDPAHPQETLPALLRLLHLAGDDATLEDVIRFVTSHPERFSVEKVQVPSVEQVVAWCRQQDAPLHAHVLRWLEALQLELADATGHKPQPPADWKRPADVACSCRLCQEINAILADPAAPGGRIRAPEAGRSHAIASIQEHQCDVTHKLEKKGSPYSLVLTKTDGSFQRRLRQYAIDQGLLATVHELLAPPKTRHAGQLAAAR